MTRTSPTTPASCSALDARTGAAVDITDVHRSFGEVRAVRGVDLRIAPGEVVAFLGPNGAGKSTTIDMLLGLTKPDRGSVTLFGADPSQAVRTGRVGAMLQSGALLPDLSVRELVSLFASLQPHPLAVEEALERAGIADIAGQRTQNLSGGQSQRVRFALAIVADPDLLVLDEPTVAMDVEVRQAFWASIRTFAASGRTVLFATHYLQEADDFADRIVVMARGSVVADGTGASIKERVSGRRLTAVIPDAGPDQLRALPCVITVEHIGGRMSLQCSDSDTALRAVLTQFPQTHEIEIHQANLEEAFLRLVATEGAAS
ncbi:MAG: ABC transporter ATP-binding protein [Nakamurella sp.]